MTRRYITGCDAVHPDRRGGQHVAMHCMGVLAVDETTGYGVLVADERSQHKCKQKADMLLDWMLEVALKQWTPPPQAISIKRACDFNFSTGKPCVSPTCHLDGKHYTEGVIP